MHNGRFILPRQQSSGSNTGTIIGLVVSGALFCVVAVAIVLFTAYRRRRLQKQLYGKAGSTTPSKKKNKTASTPGWFGTSLRTGVWSRHHDATGGQYSASLQSRDSSPTRHGGQASAPHEEEMVGTVTRAGESSDAATATNRAPNRAAGVDRNTSIRSIMTLPAYDPEPREDEQVLAREGERAGIDVVIEYPEDASEEETTRDIEMESLYQIRLARRAEAAEREERRRLRREARARGDFQALDRLRMDSRRRAGEGREALLSNQLIAEHQAAQQRRERERRVSSVQYAQLGVQRHDGTRLRSHSTDSDNRPLLDSAASMSGVSVGSGRPHSSSRLTMETLGTHHRAPSASSVLSGTTQGSDADTPRHSSDRHDSNGDFEVLTLSQTQTNRSRASSRGAAAAPNAEGFTDIDMGDMSIPTPEPPTYDTWEAGPGEEAPPYSSPIRSRPPTQVFSADATPTSATEHSSATSESNGYHTPMSPSGAPQLQPIGRLPSIRITENVSPVAKAANANWGEANAIRE